VCRRARPLQLFAMMLALLSSATVSAPASDLVKSLPGFNGSFPFKVYSGYLHVPGPFEKTDYDSLSIHYQFHTSQNDPAKDPLVTWHQGGPGGSSINVGLYTEMGYFQLDDKGGHANPYAWNKVANMLYLESPAGSGSPFEAGKGSSSCLKGGKQVGCKWDDVSQAEAYAHTLAAFHKAFPDFASHDLYLTGESYFGQYGPNIAHWILTHAPFNKTLNLKGIAAGNACWGGTATSVDCNGPNSDQNDLDMYFGKALISKKLYTAAYNACGFGNSSGHALAARESPKCFLAKHKAFEAVGPHNIYFIYDTCPLRSLEAWLQESGKSMRWLTKALRTELSTNGQVSPLRDHLLEHPMATDDASGELGFYPGADGGFVYGCGGLPAVKAWLARDDVKAALHIKKQGSSFGYNTGGPASITLWPFLAQHIRVLIYNGDADACVPYKGNEEWIDGLEAKGVLKEKEPWRPWYTGSKGGGRAPAGYVTTYDVNGAPGNDFSFVTIRLAGHMVPTYQPARAITFLERFLHAEPF